MSKMSSNPQMNVKAFALYSYYICQSMVLTYPDTLSARISNFQSNLSCKPYLLSFHSLIFLLGPNISSLLPDLTLYNSMKLL